MKVTHPIRGRARNTISKIPNLFRNYKEKCPLM
jgi:hypothetical protein